MPSCWQLRRLSASPLINQAPASEPGARLVFYLTAWSGRSEGVGWAAALHRSHCIRHHRHEWWKITHTHTQAAKSAVTRVATQRVCVSAKSEETQIRGDNFKMTLSVLGGPARWNVSPCVSLPHVWWASGPGRNDVASSCRSCVTQYPSRGSRVQRLTFRRAPRCEQKRQTAAKRTPSLRGLRCDECDCHLSHCCFHVFIKQLDQLQNLLKQFSQVCFSSLYCTHSCVFGCKLSIN